MTTAQVEVLTAEVRALMVGSRQVTLSVYRQLDRVEPDEIDPFGRVSDPQDKSPDPGTVYVVGRGTDGSLVRSCRKPPTTERQLRRWAADEQAKADRLTERIAAGEERWLSSGGDSDNTYHRRHIEQLEAERDQYLADAKGCLGWIPEAVVNVELFERWQALPLIVLAGLR